jgi:hypothetical protein
MSAAGVYAQQASELQWPSEYSHSWSLESKAKSKNKWSLDVTPFLWATSIKGTVGIRDRTAEVDISFRKILEHLRGAIMLPAEVWYGRLGVGTEVIWTNVEDEKATPGPLFSAAEVDVKQFIGDISPRFRLIGTPRGAVSTAANSNNGNNGNRRNGKNGNNGNFALDALVGIRYWRLNNKLTLTTGILPGQQIPLDDSWGDPYVGARMFYNISSRWGFMARGDVGGFDVGSKFAWQALGMTSYRIGNWGTVRLGYRQIDVDYELDSTGFIYDVGLGGVILGLTLAT